MSTPVSRFNCLQTAVPIMTEELLQILELADTTHQTQEQAWLRLRPQWEAMQIAWQISRHTTGPSTLSQRIDFVIQCKNILAPLKQLLTTVRQAIDLRKRQVRGYTASQEGSTTILSDLQVKNTAIALLVQAIQRTYTTMKQILEPTAIRLTSGSLLSCFLPGTQCVNRLIKEKTQIASP